MYELVYIVSYDNHPLLSLLTVVDGRDVVYLESALTAEEYQTIKEQIKGDTRDWRGYRQSLNLSERWLFTYYIIYVHGIMLQLASEGEITTPQIAVSRHIRCLIIVVVVRLSSSSSFNRRFASSSSSRDCAVDALRRSSSSSSSSNI